MAARVKRCVLVIGRSKVSHRQSPDRRRSGMRLRKGDKHETTGNGRVARRSETGKGSLTTERGVLDKTRDSFTTRFRASYIGHEFFEMYSTRTHSDK